MLAVGTLVQGRYQILRQLGVGGMGAVYQAQDLRLGQLVALKENIGGDPRQFQQEAFLLANLRHPNLPRVIDHFVESSTGAQYLVMDYVEGEDLESRIARQGALPEAQALAWFDQILDAVAYLQSRGVIHRDIKPANIKITPAGQAVLVDFGIAKIFRPGQRTATGARLGTPGFAAPEQYGGGTDQRSDVYSLGATLYALLTGQVPPDALSLAGRSAMLMPPRTLNASLSVETEQAILRAMAVPPLQRFQSVDEMRYALRATYIAATTPVPQPSTVPAFSTARGSQGTIVFLSLAVVALILLAGVAGFIVRAIGQSPTPTPGAIVAAVSTSAPTTAPSSTPTPTPPVFVTASTITPTAAPTFTPTPRGTPRLIAAMTTQTITSTSATTSPSGPFGQIAFASDRDGNSQIYVMNADGTNLRRLTNNSSTDKNPAWSADGRLIVFQSDRDGRNQIYVMNSDGTNQRRISNEPNGCYYPTWSPDGGKIVFESETASMHHGINLINTDGTNPVQLTDYSAFDGAPAWSPDGHSFVFASDRAGGIELFAMNSDGSNVRQLTFSTRYNFKPTWSPDGRWIAFYSERDGNDEIYVMNADGSGARRLTTSTSHDQFPTWSPDGRFIAFASDRDGNFEIYIITSEGADLRRLNVKATGNSFLAWSPH